MTLSATKGDSIGVAKVNEFHQYDAIEYIHRANGVGNVKLSDTAVVNKILNSNIAKKLRPANVKYTQFMWGYKPDANDQNNLVLYAIRGNHQPKSTG